MIEQATRATIALLVLSPLAVIAQPARAETKCISQGELVTQSGQRVTTQPVCQGDRPALIPGRAYQYLCYSATKVFTFIGAKGMALPGCVSPTARPTPCLSSAQTNCIRKGPGDDLKGPAITLPYGRALMENRPMLAWKSVSGVTTYIVKVSGPGVSWARSSSNTTLIYPQEAAPLQYGNVYTVVVIAEGNPSLISTKALSMLSQADTQQVKHAAELVRRWNLAPDEVANVLDNLYLSRGLLDQAILVLQQRIQSGSQDPQLYQKLGDRYLEAGLLDQARPFYDQAKEIAKQNGNLSVVAQAQAGLEKINQLKANHQLR